MSKQDADRLYQLISDICAAKKMTRVEIAEYLGVSERTLYRWSMGDANFPTMVFLALGLLTKEE